MDAQKVFKEVLAIILLSFFLLSFEWPRNLIYSRNFLQALIQFGLFCLGVGLGIAGKSEWIEEIIAIFLEVIIYGAVTWTSWPISTLLCTRIAPVGALIAAGIFIKQNLTKNE